MGDSRATTIVIEDSVAPVFSSFPQNYELPCDADLSETVLGTAIAFGQCAGNVTVNVDLVLVLLRDVSVMAAVLLPLPRTVFLWIARLSLVAVLLARLSSAAAPTLRKPLTPPLPVIWNFLSASPSTSTSMTMMMTLLRSMLLNVPWSATNLSIFCK